MSLSNASRAPVLHTRRSARRLVVRAGVCTVGAWLLWSAVGAAGMVPTVAVQGERTPQGAKLALRGAGWPARVPVLLSAGTPPGGTAPLDFGTAMTTTAGEFRATKLTPCTTADSAAAERVSITVTARTADGSLQATARLAAAPWVCHPR